MTPEDMVRQFRVFLLECSGKLNELNTQYLQGEATSALAGFHVGPLSWFNWNLELFVFVNGGKPENTEENPRSIQDKNQKQTQPSTASTRTTFVEAESHHCSPDHVYKLLSGFNPYYLCYFIRFRV